MSILKIINKKIKEIVNHFGVVFNSAYILKLTIGLYNETNKVIKIMD